jgi:hypothetical protein
VLTGIPIFITGIEPPGGQLQKSIILLLLEAMLSLWKLNQALSGILKVSIYFLKNIRLYRSV